MSTGASTRSPSQPAAEAENLHPHTGGLPGGGAPPGAHAPGQNPSLPHPHLVPRPVFLIPPPPPPFMPFQWPMSFYTPFDHFSGMGYGLMMPPFPPAPYVDPPTYFIPHAPVQPMDYRRMAHPQPSSTSFADPTRRPRPPRAVVVRETISFGVQTEPREGAEHGGSPPRSSSDSGRGTAPSSPTSSASSNRKGSIGDGGSCGRAGGVQVQTACSRGSAQAGSQTSNSKESEQKMAKGKCVVSSPLKSRNVHLVRQEKVRTPDRAERRVSVPDILMSWGKGDAAADKNEHLPLFEEEVTNFQSSTVMNEDLLDAETIGCDEREKEQAEEQKICFERCEHSLSVSVKEFSAGHDSVEEQTLKTLTRNAQTSGKLKKRLNESAWSVESLPVFIPTKEWFVYNMTAGPEVIMETMEEAENGSLSDKPVNQGSPQNSLDSEQMCDGCMCFSTPASKEPARDLSSAPRRPRVCALPGPKNPSDSNDNQSDLVDSVEENEGRGPSEPVCTPKRQSSTSEHRLETSAEAREKLVSLAVDRGDTLGSLHKTGPEGGVEQLAVPLPPRALTEASPSKLVHCGVQVELPVLRVNRSNLEMNDDFMRFSDFHNTSTRSEGYYGNGQQRRFHFRRKGPGTHGV